MPRKHYLTVMKKILFALSMLAFAMSAVPQARGQETTIDFFYNNLSGGNWIEVEGYGYGWQPDIVVSDPNWRPYSDGYWAYTDYGWTWISYEDFGWATYHYGRWANLADYGWVWFPGEDLDWGPAWVSWRTGGDYIGWAPLPPRGPGVVYGGQPIGFNVDIVFDIGPEYYNFCDVRFIGEPVLRDRIFPTVQNVTYITNTVNVTNIYVQNNVVYNYGPDYNVVNTYSSRPIQRLTIERQTPGNLNAALKSGTLTKVQGNKLVVAAPLKIAKAPPTAKPAAVKAKVAQPKIQRGWKGVPNEAELKEKIKNQNPRNIPPPTRAAAREVGSPVPTGGTSPKAAAAGSPAPRGKPARVAPGATAAPLGVAPSPFEHGKGKPGARPRPGAAAVPGEGATERVSPPPVEGAKPGGRPRPGMTSPQPGPREGLSPSQLEPGRGRGKPAERSPEPGVPGRPTGATGEPPPSAFQGAPPEPEHGRQPGRRPSEASTPGQGGPGQIPPQGRGRGPETEQFGAQPGGAAERGQRGGGPPSGFRQPVTPPAGGGPAGESAAQKGRGQGFQGQPQQQQQQQQQPQGGAPAGAGRGQGQPEGGKKKPAKETPPPGPR
jgi:hypothetical protein